MLARQCRLSHLEPPALRIYLGIAALLEVTAMLRLCVSSYTRRYMLAAICRIIMYVASIRSKRISSVATRASHYRRSVCDYASIAWR